MLNRTFTRREFIRTATTATAIAPYGLTHENVSAREFKSKNDRPHLAAIGVGGRGLHVTQLLAKFCEVVAVCDVDLHHAERAKAQFGGKPTIYQDYRKLLERNDIDIVFNGTPDHWHTPINIAAMKSGHDVYTEKPLTLTINEGKTLRDVVKSTGRIVQVGTQQRSDKRFQLAVELVRNGRIGKLKQVWVAVPYFSTKGGPFPASSVPDSLDWDMYQGQAPEHDYCKQRTHGSFRWWYEYAGGIVTDWGNHHVDVAHWGMDCELTGPTSIEGRAFFPNPEDPTYFNTPDRFFSRMLYPNGVEVLYFSSLNDRQRFGDVQEHQPMSTEQIEQLFGTNVPKEITTFARNGIMFIGDKGRVFVNRGGIYGKPVNDLEENPLPDDAWRVSPSNDHAGNFVQCVKTRQEPISPVRIQHRSITACHLTNIALRLNRRIQWDPKTEQIVGDDEAAAMQHRKQRTPYTIEA